VLLDCQVAVSPPQAGEKGSIHYPTDTRRTPRASSSAGRRSR
jgi:hypothetical protein